MLEIVDVDFLVSICHRECFQQMEVITSNIIFGSQITVLVLCIYILSPEYLRPPTSLTYRNVSKVIDEYF